jgi:hypothetical protein
MLTAWTDVRHVPGTTSAENANVAQRWRDAGLEPPE